MIGDGVFYDTEYLKLLLKTNSNNKYEDRMIFNTLDVGDSEILHSRFIEY